MKRGLHVFLLAIGLMIAFGSVASSQVRFGLGLRTGLNFGTMSFDPELFTDPRIEKGGRTGFLIGAAAELEFAHMFAAEMDLLYVMKGAKYTRTTDQAFEAVRLSELEIPILFKVKFLPGKIRPYAFAGPVLGIVMSATDVQEIPGAQQQRPDIDLKSNPGGTQVSSMDFGLQFGGGAEFMVMRNFGVFMDVRYALGLTNLYDTSTNQRELQEQQLQQAIAPSWKTRGFMLQVGGMFHL